MKAATFSQYGPPEVVQLQEVDTPVPSENQVLVKIRATTVTSGDARMRRADPFLVRFFLGLTAPKKPAILGTEFSGEVVSTGTGVSKFKPGDHVFGMAGFGAHAEYLLISENGMIGPKPGNISFEEAASIPFGAHAALHFLRKGQIGSGKKVLIYGASGSLGTAGVQIARSFGGDVTGVCSTANVELVKSLGVQTVIDYKKEDFSRRGDQYDIIFDTIGKSPFGASVRSLKNDGYYLRAVHMSPGPVLQGLWTSMISGKKIIGGVAAERQEDMALFKDLVENGKLKPVIDRVYPFDQIAEAHRLVDSGHKKGNVVVKVA